MFCSEIFSVIIVSLFLFVNNNLVDMKATKPPPKPKLSAKFLLAVNDTWNPNGYNTMHFIT